MTSFPLYDSLCKDLDSEEITTKEQNKFMKLIENFDVTGYELLYILKPNSFLINLIIDQGL